MDMTASMSTWIEKTKNETRAILAAAKRKFDADLRVGFVGYRDHCDEAHGIVRLETLDFLGADKMDVFEKFLKTKCRAAGGGDVPEDVAGGLEACTHLSWESNVRLVVMFADAPAHGDEYHPFGRDGKRRYTDQYPKGDPHGLDCKELVRTLVHEIGANFYFIKIHAITDQMVGIFESAVQPLDGKEFKTFNLGSNVCWRPLGGGGDFRRG